MSSVGGNDSGCGRWKVAKAKEPEAVPRRHGVFRWRGSGARRVRGGPPLALDILQDGPEMALAPVAFNYPLRHLPQRPHRMAPPADFSEGWVSPGASTRRRRRRRRRWSMTGGNQGQGEVKGGGVNMIKLQIKSALHRSINIWHNKSNEWAEHLPSRLISCACVLLNR